MSDSLYFKLNSGKPVKAWDFVRNFAGLVIPDSYYRRQLQGLLNRARQRADYEQMLERVNYYIRCRQPFAVPAEDERRHEPGKFFYTGCLGDYRRKDFHTAYYFDQHDVTRYFQPQLRWSFLPGDVYFTPEKPTVVKSRLLTADNTNSVLLKLDKLRHFFYVNDRTPFREKQDALIFRGKIRQSRLRSRFLELYHGSPGIDACVVGRNEGCPEAWMGPKKTVAEHLQYKFILALEGNDVASNLKWVMSSNSLPMMTQPTCETWFMEGTLKPNVHYVEISEDLHDVREKMNYYIAHPDEAEEILRNAHDYVRRFFDTEREQLLQLMVLHRYFELSGQL